MFSYLNPVLIVCGYVTGLSGDSQAEDIWSLSLTIPGATSVGRGAGEEMAETVTYIFKSLKTEAPNQDFFGFSSV